MTSNIQFKIWTVTLSLFWFQHTNGLQARNSGPFSVQLGTAKANYVGYLKTGIIAFVLSRQAMDTSSWQLYMPPNEENMGLVWELLTCSSTVSWELVEILLDRSLSVSLSATSSAPSIGPETSLRWGSVESGCFLLSFLVHWQQYFLISTNHWNWWASCNACKVRSYMKVDLVLNLKKFEIFELDTEELPAATTPTVFDTPFVFRGPLGWKRTTLPTLCRWLWLSLTCPPTIHNPQKKPHQLMHSLSSHLHLWAHFLQHRKLAFKGGIGIPWPHRGKASYGQKVIL